MTSSDTPPTAVSQGECVVLSGARTHNLRDVSVRFPRGVVVAFTGISGSGKTSLAIDTLHSEAQLRYLEGLSPFVRQYITQRNRPVVDRITGLGATLAVDQRRLNRNPRSTVATITGIDGHLGLLYSRLPTLATEYELDSAALLTTAHFDRHTPEGGCPACHGVGGTWHASPDLIITEPGLPLFDGASPWYAKWHSGEHAMVPALAESWGVDLGRPWQDLPQHFRDAVMYGTGDEVVETSVTMPNKHQTGEWSYTTRNPMRGAVAEVERVFANAGTDRAKQRYLPYMRKSDCEVCQGSGYGEAAREITLGGVPFSRLIELDVHEVRRWASYVEAGLGEAQRQVSEPLFQTLRSRLARLEQLGLAHLQLHRSATSLSGGELQRTRLAAQLSTDLTGIMFVLDEPGTGLHPADKAHLLAIAGELKEAGNTVLLVEHDPELVARADWVVDLGPGAGRGGGRVLVSGPPEEVAACEESVTGRYLRGNTARIHREPLPVQDGADRLTLHGVRVHNVDVPEVSFPLGRLTCLTGVSGSGKSSLLHDALGKGVEAHLSDESAEAVRRVTGSDRIGWIAVVDQEPIGRTPRSNPATYSKAFDMIRELYARTDRARELGMKASSFSFNAKSGRCETCAGYGRKLVDMHFLPDVWVVCDVCDGSRFGPQTQSVTYKGMSIGDVLRLTVEEAVEVFGEPKQLTAILSTLEQVGLGYLQLGQSATELSGGEAQRLKLANAIQRGSQGKRTGLVVLDEPVSGLHPSDVQRIVDTFDVLLDHGNTVVIAEHDMHVAAAADWVIDLGPGAGGAGGRIVVEGTPKEVVDGDGVTARYLRQLLAGEPLVTADAEVSVAGRAS
ncbi:excinuclease ABC subunit UvrA [Actinopolyspora saharensis]|uniref:excinuclease ABC subunit UvrA n=1 Tax=Actinopolyspora saharensis TaxID=995062 RepID=UPI003F67ED5C